MTSAVILLCESKTSVDCVLFCCITQVTFKGMEGRLTPFNVNIRKENVHRKCSDLNCMCANRTISRFISVFETCFRYIKLKERPCQHMHMRTRRTQRAG